MARADVLQLVADLSDGLADQTQSGRYYDDVIFDLGLSVNETLTNVSMIQVVAGQGSYSYPGIPLGTPSAVRLLGLAFDDVYLQPSDVSEAQGFDADWRSLRGEPRTWLIEQEARRTFTLVPVPTKTGTIVAGDSPFSATFPDGNITAIYNESRADVHSWMELWLALQIVAREFSRDSDHTDKEFAQYAEQLADGIGVGLGISSGG